MLTQSDLDQFTGDLTRYRLGRNLLFTPGVKYLCEHGGEGEDGTAWWLLDVVASYQGDKRINSNEDLRYLQFWTLKVDDGKGVVTCDDGNGNVVIKQKIPYTDFCLPEAKIWVGWNGDNTRTAYLPSEH